MWALIKVFSGDSFFHQDDRIIQDSVFHQDKRIIQDKAHSISNLCIVCLRPFKFNPTFYFIRSHFHLQGLEGHEGLAARTSSEVTISTDCGQIAKPLTAAIKIFWSLHWFSLSIILLLSSSFLSLSLSSLPLLSFLLLLCSSDLWAPALTRDKLFWSRNIVRVEVYRWNPN